MILSVNTFLLLEGQKLTQKVRGLVRAKLSYKLLEPAYSTLQWVFTGKVQWN